MPRGKSQEQRDFDNAHRYSCVSVKLKPLLRQPFSRFHRLLDDIAHLLSKLAFEAYILANLHVLRCLNNNQLPLPKIDQAFFRSCCTLVSDSGRNAGSDDLQETARQYFELRPQGYVGVDTKHLHRAIDSLAKQMITMFKNHIVFGIVQRLCAYVRHKYRAINNKSRAKAFVCRAVFGNDEEDNLEEEDPGFFEDDVQDFRVWLDGKNPFLKGEVKQNIPHYITKLFEILQFYDTLDPNTKGIRRFSLIPLKGDYISSFFQINSSTLPEILKLLGVGDQRSIVQTMIPSFPEGSEERTFLENQVEARTIFDRRFQQMRTVSDALWRVLFKVEDYETTSTGKRRFGRMISTNGYAASIYMQVPKPVGEDEPEPPDGEDDDDDPGFDSPHGLKEDDFDTFIGIDPGQVSFVAFAGQVDDRGRSKCIEVSTGEIRHHSKMNQQKRWMRKQVQRYQEYGRRSTSLPTLRTGALDVFKDNVQVVLGHADYLFNFERKEKFRAWRFKTQRFGQKALVQAVKKILDGHDPKKTLIGFGDWSQQDGLKGHDKAPVKKLRRMIRAFGVKVVKVDEHRTSKCCSKCRTGENENVKYNGRKCHRVIRCNNNACNTYWHRDVNGSRNIHAVLMSMVRNEPQRPVGLRRQGGRRRGRAVPQQGQQQ